VPHTIGPRKLVTGVDQVLGSPRCRRHATRTKRSP
jgi:hypothetical protein